MKGKKSRVRTYIFTLNVVCKHSFLNDFEFGISAISFNSAWLCVNDRQFVSDYLAYIGFPDISVQKVHFVSCDIFERHSDLCLYKVKTVSKIR